MRKLSTTISYLLVLSFLITVSSRSAAQKWPVNQQIDLSSGFGDYRPGHYHGGVDIRTGGQVGWTVVAPVAGYVYRVKMAYTGYGKGLYLMGDDGHIYVFGHLSRLADKVRDRVRAMQLEQQEYNLDHYFDKDEIRFQAGERIGQSGESGSGAPHLHFEKRTSDNVPINPLMHGFTLEDKTAPAFERISFAAADDTVLFDNASRQLFSDVKRGNDGIFRPDSIFYFNEPFGVLVDGYDQMREGGMRQAVSSLTLYVDGQEVYRSVLYSLAFETTGTVDLEYDYLEAVNDNKRVRRLFELYETRPTSGKSAHDSKGIFSQDFGLEVGRHEARIVGEDSFGNRSALEFEFLWGDPQGLFHLDTLINIASDTTDFVFEPVSGWKGFGLDSVRVALNRGKLWGIVPDQKVSFGENGRMHCVLPGNLTERVLLRLVGFIGNRIVVIDPPFNGVVEGGKPNFKFLWEPVEDGLLVQLECVVRVAYKPKVELYYGDSLLGTEYPQLFNMEYFAKLIPPRPEYRRIDKMKVSLSSDPDAYMKTYDSMMIFQVGREERQLIEVDDQFSFEFSKDGFYGPRYIEIRSYPVPRMAVLHIDSKLYEVLPKVFLTRENFKMRYKFHRTSKLSELGGICWLDEKNDRWVWLDNEYEAGVLEAESTGGGSFVTKFDYDKPELKQLNIINGRSYSNPNQSIRFTALDSLSGVGETKCIELKLDGEWQIVDYDPETGRCYCDPAEPLTNGSHHLAIVLTDRAGNVTERYLNFKVNARKATGSGN